MRKYAAELPLGDLEDWPFDNPDSDYRIIRGNPKAAGRIDFGGNHLRHGWASGLALKVLSNAELGDELQTILIGRLRLTRANGESIQCVPVDSVFTRKGERVIWDIEEDVTKVFSRTWAEVFHSKSTYTFPTEASESFRSFSTLTLRCDSIAKRKPFWLHVSLFATTVYRRAITL